MKANDMQIGGAHYKGKDIQHWDIAVQEEWDYLTGCVTKYMWRWKKKNGLEDLQKAAHYLQKLIEQESTYVNCPDCGDDEEGCTRCNPRDFGA